MFSLSLPLTLLKLLLSLVQFVSYFLALLLLPFAKRVLAQKISVFILRLCIYLRLFKLFFIFFLFFTLSFTLFFYLRCMCVRGLCNRKMIYRSPKHPHGFGTGHSPTPPLPAAPTTVTAPVPDHVWAMNSSRGFSAIHLHTVRTHFPSLFSRSLPN